jgi:hypothetical protein
MDGTTAVSDRPVQITKKIGDAQSQPTDESDTQVPACAPAWCIGDKGETWLEDPREGAARHVFPASAYNRFENDIVLCIFYWDSGMTVPTDPIHDREDGIRFRFQPLLRRLRPMRHSLDSLHRSSSRTPCLTGKAVGHSLERSTRREEITFGFSTLTAGYYHRLEGSHY